MSEVINVFAKPANKKMSNGVKIALIIGAVILALIVISTVALGAIGALSIGTIGAVSVGTMLVLDLDISDIAFVAEDFLFFLDGYYA